MHNKMKATRDDRYLNLVIWLFFAVSGESALRWDQEPLNPTTAVEGSNVSLKWDYNLDGGTLDLVQWTQKESGLTIGRIIPPSSYSVKPKFRPRFTISETEEATLIITNVSRSDAGEIDCKVGDDEEEIISTIRLIVLYLPENISLHTSANVSATLKNSTVDFWCTADGNPAPHYKLSYNSIKLGKSSSGIFQIQVTESGLYICEAKNSAGIGSASVYINVVVPDPATADVSLSPDHVQEGHDVTLHCRVTGSKPLSIKWNKVNKSNVLSNSSELTLYNVMRPGTPDEVLQYKCTAKNAYGDSASDVVIIKVYYPPEITTMNVRVQEGNTSAALRDTLVTFNCTSHASPSPSDYSFYYNGTQFGSSSSGMLKKQVSESGHYFCAPKNKVGFGDNKAVSITVVDSPTVDLSSNPNSVREGETLNLTCAVTGSKPISVEWKEDGDSTVLSRNQLLTRGNVTRPNTLNQTLHYQCTAKNGYGEPKSDVLTIRVFYPPENTTMNVRVQEGNTSAALRHTLVTFNCTSHASPPPHYFFYHNGAPFGSSRSGMLHKQVSESGNYSCAPKNKVGFGDNAAVFLTIVVPTKIAAPQSIQLVEGTSDTLFCNATGDPKPSVKWRKDNEPEVISTSPKYIVSADKAVTKYHCEAQNGYGHPLIQKVTFVVSVTKLEKEDSEVQVNLRIVSEEYVEEYSNPMSNKTKALKSRLISENSLLFTKGNLKLLGIRIDRISKGSIVVEYTMFFRGSVETNAVADAIKKAIEDGRFGNFTVDKDSLEVTQTTATATTTTTTTIPAPTQKTDKVSTAFMVIIIIVVLVVVVILVIVVIWRCKKKRRCRKGSGKIQQQYETYEFAENTQNVIENKAISYEINNQSSFQDNSRRDYASLDETRRSPATEIQPQVSVYMSLSPKTRSWEVPKESLTVEKIIGKGAFGQVAKATVVNLRGSRGEKTVAVKMLKENAPASDRKDLLSELEIMKTLATHPHVIKLLGCVTTSETLMVIIEYVPYGDLLGYLRKSRGLNDTYYKDPDVKPKTNLTSQQLMKFAWQVADGMSFLSSNKIVHRDLAARNVLVGDQETCKVTDFGMARDVHQEDIYQKKTKGRLPVKWTAYEALLYGTYSTKSDVWSYGVVLYEIFTVGGCPYPKIDRRKLAELLHQGYRMPKPAHLDDELYAIMLQCWRESDDRRPSFESLKNRMRGLEKRHKLLIDMKKYDKKLYENVEDLLG